MRKIAQKEVVKVFPQPRFAAKKFADGVPVEEIRNQLISIMKTTLSISGCTMTRCLCGSSTQEAMRLFAKRHKIFEVGEVIHIGTQRGVVQPSLCVEFEDMD